MDYNIAEWIKATRARKVQSQTEAAAQMGIHRVTLSRWERAEQSPEDLASLRAIASWAGISLAELVTVIEGG